MQRVTVVAVVVSSALLVAATASADAVKIPRDVPYAADARIAENIKRECTDLGDKLAEFLAQYAGEHDVETVAVDHVDPHARGRVLVVEITDAVSGGNAFIGHRKSMSARAELFVDGVSKGDVNFTRDSMGGAAAAFKGSCSVLGRCTKALGRDLAEWLAKQ